MALSRRGGANRFSSTIWPGFVDAMTALLMVMMFVLTIFMVVQSVLRDQVDRQETQLDRLTDQVAGLTGSLAVITSERDAGRADLADAQGQISDFQIRISEIAAAEAAAAQRAGTAETTLAETRSRLENAQAELTAMTLSLDENRRKAEETLTLLAAAEAARRDLSVDLATTTTEAERQAALVAVAQQKLAGQEQASTEAQRRVALLNAQVATLNTQLSSIQRALAISQDDSAADELRLEDLGAKLNAALLRASDEQSRRLALEQTERERLESEAANLSRYRSEFFGRLSQILQGREGVEIVGDRFVFQSEVLFGQGETTLSSAGRDSVARVTTMLKEIASTIPPEIDWVIRVDGHTDSTPLSGSGRYRDNWELSQARALAVVRDMVDNLGFPADRVAPTGFADTRPIADGDSPESRASNRRIELKLTER